MITPFHFNLKKVSASEQRLLDAVHEYLPATSMRDGFQRGIEEAIARHTGDDFSIELEAVRREPYSAFLAALPEIAVMAVVGLAPLPSKAILEMDSPIALLAVERLLGGAATGYPAPRPLSDAEQGVLEYLLLQAMSHVHRLSGLDERVHFRLDRLAFGRNEVRDVATQDSGVAVLTFRASIGRHAGFARLVLPDPFVAEGLLTAVDEASKGKGERRHAMDALGRFGHVKVSLWAEAGRTSISASELGQIEEGDVVLLDQTRLALTGGSPSGVLVLRVGGGMHGGIAAELKPDKGRIRCKVLGIHRGD